MNDEKQLQYFNETGLPEAHIKFAAQFLEADTPARQIAVVPIGGGKGRLLLSIAKYVANQGGRVLLLADRVEIREQYRARLQHDNVMSINLDRPTMRSLQAGSTIPRIQWQLGYIYTATIQFISTGDIKPQILQTMWDLVIVDDARWTKFLTELSLSSAYKRLLIVLPFFSSEDRTGKLQGIDVHVLGPMNSDLQPKFELETVEFRRSQKELELFQAVLQLTKQLSSISNLIKDFRGQLIRQRAASSFYALELTLTRLRQNLLVQRNFAAHNPDSDVDGTSLALLTSNLDLLDNLLVQLDEIEVDSKQQALSRLLNQLSEKHVIVYTNMSDTASFLSESLNRSGFSSFHIGGSTSFQDYGVSLDEFMKSGGIAFISNARRLVGYDLRTVLSTVILYDVPQNDMELLVLVSRANPQNARVYLLKEASGLLGDNLKALRSLVAKLGLEKE